MKIKRDRELPIDGGAGGGHRGNYLAGWNKVWAGIFRGRDYGVLGVIYVVLLVILVDLTTGKQASSGIAAVLIMATIGAITVSTVGRLVPVVRSVGLDTIAIVFVPSLLVHLNWIHPGTIEHARELFISTDVIGLYVTLLIVGSIIAIDRRVLISGSMKLLVPICAGSVSAVVIGTLVGTSLGLGSIQTLFLIVVPILGGGISAGAMPLSVGYGNVLGFSQGEILASLLPAVILGNLTAMIFAGLLNFMGTKFSQQPEEGRTMGSSAILLASPLDSEEQNNLPLPIVLAVALILAYYLVSLLAARLFYLPAPLTVLFLTVLTNVTNLLPMKLRVAIRILYRFLTSIFTYPLLFAVGLLLTPWERLVEGFTPVHLAVILTAVGSMAAVGFFASRWVGLNSTDGAIVTVTRAAMGGTGDITILSAGNRLEFMPFAQISTRVGGAGTVAAALIALKCLPC
jgi:malate:Na+ symporter